MLLEAYNETLSWLTTWQRPTILFWVTFAHVFLGLVSTSHFDHSTLSHNAIQIRRRWYYVANWVSSVYLHAGTDPKQGWGTPHTWHHLFPEIPRMDPYSLKEYSFKRVFFWSAGCLSEYNHRPGVAETIPNRMNNDIENYWLGMKKWFILGPAYFFWFVFFPAWMTWDDYSIVGGIAYVIIGAICVLLFIFGLLIGGGTINSIAHSTMFKASLLWYYAKGMPLVFPKAIDGSEAQNHTILGIIIGEGWHRNHHDQPWNSNFGRNWYEFHWIYYYGRLMQSLGIVEMSYQPHVFDLDEVERRIHEWMRDESDANKLRALLRLATIKAHAELIAEGEYQGRYRFDWSTYDPRRFILDDVMPLLELMIPESVDDDKVYLMLSAVQRHAQTTSESAHAIFDWHEFKPGNFVLVA